MKQLPLLDKLHMRKCDVYIAFVPGIPLSKIGLTKRFPKTRLKEQGNLSIHKLFHCQHEVIAALVEDRAHMLLKQQGFWLPPGLLGLSRETFNCDLLVAEKTTSLAYEQVFTTLGKNPDLCLDIKSAKKELGQGFSGEQLDLNIDDVEEPHDG